MHDVWAFRLRGGEGRTLLDFQALLSSERMQRVNPVVGGLFKLRFTLGKLFGWDDEKRKDTPSSYVHRLTEDDRIQSLDEPGSASRVSGPLSMRWPPVIYAFENEYLFEIINVTGDHFLLMAMETASEGYTVYWAVYTKRTSWLTPLYMALIDPFRRVLVYPAIINRLERTWAEAHGG